MDSVRKFQNQPAIKYGDPHNNFNSHGTTPLNSPPGRDMHNLVKKFRSQARGVFQMANPLVDFPIRNKILTIANDSI